MKRDDHADLKRAIRTREALARAAVRAHEITRSYTIRPSSRAPEETTR